MTPNEETMPDEIYVRWEGEFPAKLAAYHSTNHPQDFTTYIRQESITVPDGLPTSIKMVEEHQSWRRGADMELQNPTLLGEAIDELLTAARELQRIKEMK